MGEKATSFDYSVWADNWAIALYVDKVTRHGALRIKTTEKHCVSE
jgi:hypothetical protein